MDIDAALAKFFQENSLTDIGIYLDSYDAIVEKTSDGSEAPADHIQVICPSLFGEEVYERWIPQRRGFAGKNIGLYAIPQKGDRVTLTFRNGDKNNPFWEYGGWLQSGEGIPETAKGKPESIVLQNIKGQRIEMDSDGKIVIHNSDDVNILLDNDKITIKNGDTEFLIDSDGKVKIEVNGYSLKNLLDELLQALLNMKVSTSIGAQPAINLFEFSTIKNSKIPQLLK